MQVKKLSRREIRKRKISENNFSKEKISVVTCDNCGTENPDNAFECKKCKRILHKVLNKRDKKIKTEIALFKKGIALYENGEYGDGINCMDRALGG
jgi:ribosomal protein L40E